MGARDEITLTPVERIEAVLPAAFKQDIPTASPAVDGEGVRSHLSERPAGRSAQMVPDPFSALYKVWPDKFRPC